MKRSYKLTSDMIKAAVAAGYTHTGGKGFQCRACKNKTSLRKFRKGPVVNYACKCGFRG